VIEIVAGNKEPVMSLSDLSSDTGGHLYPNLHSGSCSYVTLLVVSYQGKRTANIGTGYEVYIVPSVELVLRGDAGSNVGDIDGATVHIIEVRIGNAVWLSALFL